MSIDATAVANGMGLNLMKISGFIKMVRLRIDYFPTASVTNAIFITPARCATARMSATFS